MLGPSLLQLGRQRLLLLAEQIHLLRLDRLDLGGRGRHQWEELAFAQQNQTPQRGAGLTERRERQVLQNERHVAG